MQNGYVCINCGKSASRLYERYSETVLKLSQCENCGQVIDRYVEYDLMLIIVDLLLQNVSAYRHVLFNSGLQSYWRLSVIFTLCDAYHKWIERRALDFPDQSLEIYDLEWRFYLSLVQSIAQTSVFVCVALALIRFKSGNKESQHLAKGLLAGNVVVVLAIVWQLHQNLSYLILTRLFIFVSHVQILRAMRPYSAGVAVSIVTVSSLCQLLTGWILSSYSNHFAI